MNKLRGPKFIQYFQPVIDGLRALGYSARPREIYAWVAETNKVPREELEETTKAGQSKFENKIGWARFYLAKAGIIETEQRGVWVLTERGRKTTLSHDDAYNLFRQIHDGFRLEEAEQTEPSSQEKATGEAQTLVIDERFSSSSAPDEKIYFNQDQVQEQIVHILRTLTDRGFEELSARLLRHLGFENLKVTGQTGDRGIDGEGYLVINRFVRIKVMFQCKRYSNSVQVKEIRDFRGALQGRAERGIFLTTGTFTRSAREEASRENATAIELVDIDRLLELLIEEGLGVKETKALTIDREFFSPYQRQQE
jgi:restriction system protein